MQTASPAHPAASPSLIDEPRPLLPAWVIVVDPGTDYERIAATHEFRRVAEAILRDYQAAGVTADLMRRRANGTLTTEF